MIRISAAESQVMEALWRTEAMTPDEIVAEVGPANQWTRNTVRVLITRLVNKGAIRGGKEADGRFLYRPLLARDAYVEAESGNLLDRLFEGRVAPMVAHLVKTRQLTSDDIAELNTLIEALKNDR